MESEPFKNNWYIFHAKVTVYLLFNIIHIYYFNSRNTHALIVYQKGSYCIKMVTYPIPLIHLSFNTVSALHILL